MSKSSKTTVLKEQPKLHKRVLNWSNYTVLPFLAKAIILFGFGYAVVNNMARFNALPQTAQGAVDVILIALLLKVATNKRVK